MSRHTQAETIYFLVFAGRHLASSSLGDPILSGHGFALASPTGKTELLKTYWNIPDRQVDTSVVLANPPLDEVIE